nr:hypothetical protein NG677_16880 [Methylobacterium sp. OTU13CASTA1]
MEPIKAIGYPGSWFAKVGEELLPCIHAVRITDGLYTEPYVKAGKGKWPKFLAAIKDGRSVVVTRSVLKNGEPQRRAGYDAVHRIEDFSLNGSTMQFRVTELLQALK